MFSTIKSKLKKEHALRIKKLSLEQYRIQCWREQGMHIGENVHIYSDLFSKEPYMISIDSHTTVSGNVTFVTHDNSISKYLPQFTDIFGKITIGKNCFIGMGVMILAGVTLGDSTIVAAGSVVTKSFPEGGVVVGGVPAKVICTVNDLIEKNQDYGFNIRGLSEMEKRKLLEEHPEKMINR